MYYRIGQAARQLGISEHALRQWARRYRITASHRSEGGQRLYSEQDMQRLTLIIQGKEKGLRLSDMARLSIAALVEVAGEPSAKPRVFWQGASRAKLESSFPDVDWLPEDPGDQVQVLRVFEFDTVTADEVDRLPTASGQLSVVFYEYASRPMQKAVNAKGYEALAGPASEDWLTLTLQHQLNDRQFTNAELDRLQSIQPELECECPNHVAAILKQLRHFAHYSLDCKTQNEHQAWVHQQIYRHIQDAQQDVEAALRLIVEEEGL